MFKVFRVFRVYAKYTVTPQIRIPNADGCGVGEGPGRGIRCSLAT